MYKGRTALYAGFHFLTHQRYEKDCVMIFHHLLYEYIRLDDQH